MRIVVVILLVVIGAQPVLAQNARALRAAAERALNKDRFCDASFLYAKLEDQEPNGDALSLAGEAAERADDRPRALAFYKSFVSKSPRHPRVRAAEGSIAALEKLIAKSGNGRACGAAPPAECGNGLVEGAESCDDGNTQDGDRCSRTCGGGGYSAAPTPLPGPTVVPVAVPLPAPPPPAPGVVTPPAPPPPPPPTAAPPPPPPTAAPPPPAPAPTPAAAAVPGDGELCTLIKPLKIFQKGEWKNLDFGSTITIKSRGEDFSKVDTSGGEAKIASSALEGACAKEGGATKPEKAAAGTTEAPRAITFDDSSAGEGEGEDAAEAPAATPAPAAAAEEPAPKAEPEVPEVKPETIDELQDERKPAAVVPEVEEEGGGGGIGGWITMGVGAALLSGGAALMGVGVMPFLEHQGQCGASVASLNGCPALDSLGSDYQDAEDDEERADVAEEARRLKTHVDNAAQDWDSQGRWLVAGGGAAAGVGLAVAVTGLIIALASGGEEEVE